MLNNTGCLTQKKMKVEVWTDIMCPYCYIGKIHYEKALQQFAHADEVELEWKAFQLNPNLPDRGRGYPAKEYMVNIVGYPEEAIEKMFANIRKLADNVGVPFNLPNSIVANTRDAHRLIKLAATKGLDSVVVGKLGKAYLRKPKITATGNCLFQSVVNLDWMKMRSVACSKAMILNTRSHRICRRLPTWGSIPYLLFDRQATGYHWFGAGGSVREGFE